MTKAGNSQIMRTITLLITIFSLSLPAYAKYSGGTGEPNDPYQIATVEDLMLLGDSPEDYDKHFILTDDIDLDPNLPGRKVFHMAVIAPYSADSELVHGGPPFTPFIGVFDGNNLTISNLTINGSESMGLFRVLGFGSEVRNLRVVDINMVSFGGGNGDAVGGLVGTNYGSVVNCYSVISISGHGFNVGGLVGKNHGSMNNCDVDGEINGNEGVGGLVGWNLGGSLTNCYSTCTSNGYGDNVGGLVGKNWSGTVSGCYGVGVVSGNEYVGGLVGDNAGSITNCYGKGEVRGTSGVGGLVGNNRGSVINCYSKGEVSGEASVGGLVGTSDDRGHVANSFWEQREENQGENAEGTGKTKIEMQMESTFTDAGWDFVDETRGITESCVWTNDDSGVSFVFLNN